ncbi:helix-turn-helix domain-containing protein [Comamonas sp. 26]|uniref:helix-turn-helix domain-containing protein n=1 Tax=Comamonas sp. 26 TaxID=2035201 RepID=UPI000C17A27A|nr:helix-turn-helix domain-containing protein [Comamonas sp. 26]PIG09939.1 excisionase family DNA binding protein [Comamonas sp. 26]
MDTPAQIIDSEIYTAAQLAELLSCDKETAEARIRSGDLPGIKFGKGWVIPRQALLQCLNDMAQAEAAKRRAELQRTRADALDKGQDPAAPSPLLPSSEPRRTRGQRRTPPDLSGLLSSTGLAC